MTIELKKEIEELVLTSIKRYFAENMEDEIGDLKAKLILDFCLEEIGPSIYNQAISDAQVLLHQHVEDLEGSLYEPVFGYWNDQAKG